MHTRVFNPDESNAYELYHSKAYHKYIKKERRPYGYRYWYTKAIPSKKISAKSMLNEAARAKDDVIYDAKVELIKAKTEFNNREIDRKYPAEQDLANKPLHLLNAGSAVVRIGFNYAMKALNNIGNGKLDNLITDTVNKGKQFFKKYFA